MPTSDELAQRLFDLRARMKKKGASFCMIRSTDPYLNEYVPTDKSRRVYFTGFTGSLGEALIGLESAYLFVDGRYALQAKEEAVHFDVKVLPLGVSNEDASLEKLKELAKGTVVLIEEDRIPQNYFEKLKAAAKEFGFKLSGDHGFEESAQSLGKLWAPARHILGSDLSQRLAKVKSVLLANRADGFLLVALDDIAWLSGYRGLDFPYQSTFAARAIAFKDELCLITKHSPTELSAAQLRVVDTIERAAAKNLTIGYDPDSTPIALLKQLEASGAATIAMSNPVQQFKALKCAAEIDHMYDTFARADQVVFETQTWVCEQVTSKKKITEADVDAYVRARFKASGTVELSFKPICGYAKNGAIIHHSTPDAHVTIEEGELFLLDTGGIYEGGYATDLTRTFLVGGPNAKAKKAHQQMFTLVLKGAIAGMSARMPKGFTGVQLDALVRAPFWQLGLNYAHGTGHGIGINVHEFPPRVAVFGHAKIEVGHVFSIEPGLYIPGFGGVRIENLCTVVQDPDHEGFLRVLPLTFAPLDERLFDEAMLSPYERMFLAFFKRRFEAKEKAWNLLPPLDLEPAELMRVLPSS